MSKNKPKKPYKKKPSDRKALRYSNLGFQLLAAIGIGVFIGMKVDKHYANETPYGTAAGALLGITVGLYNGLRDLL